MRTSVYRNQGVRPRQGHQPTRNASGNSGYSRDLFDSPTCESRDISGRSGDHGLSGTGGHECGRHVFQCDGLSDQLEAPERYGELEFTARLGLLVDREAQDRDNRRLTRNLKTARLRAQACVEDIDFRRPRGLDRTQILNLAEGGWVTDHRDLLISGATGCGKTYLACALAQAAIRRGHRALYWRMPRLLDELRMAHADGEEATAAVGLTSTEMRGLGGGNSELCTGPGSLTLMSSSVWVRWVTVR